MALGFQSNAFQSNAFQSNAFQTEAGGVTAISLRDSTQITRAGLSLSATGSPSSSGINLSGSGLITKPGLAITKTTAMDQ